LNPNLEILTTFLSLVGLGRFNGQTFCTDLIHVNTNQHRFSRWWVWVDLTGKPFAPT